jgi:hypothetical protein
LYIALVELMVSEGGEPGSSKAQREAWRKANEVIQQYKEELDKGIMGKPTMSYKAVESMSEGK